MASRLLRGVAILREPAQALALLCSDSRHCQSIDAMNDDDHQYRANKSPPIALPNCFTDRQQLAESASCRVAIVYFVVSRPCRKKGRGREGFD